MTIPRYLAVAVCASALIAASARGAGDDHLLARSPLAKPQRLAVLNAPHRIVVKFCDSVRARAAGPRVVSQAGADLSSLAAIEARGAVFAPLLRAAPDDLRRLEHRAAAASGRAQPDLGGLMVVEPPPGRGTAAEKGLLAALLASDLVEFVTIEPLEAEPPCECARELQNPTECITPDLFGEGGQPYHGPLPGLNMTEAWALTDAARGGGMRFADCEVSYNAQHEDLCAIHDDGEVMGDAPGHGTSVLGIAVGLDNDYGCTGLVPDAEAFFFSELTSGRTDAIVRAALALGPGDVMLLEMQTSSGSPWGFGLPAEVDPAVWTVVRCATDAGIVVVAAAGNGSRDLDGPELVEYRSRGDSGAIIVGAGWAENTADYALRSTMTSSTFGARVNLQGWGNGVLAPSWTPSNQRFFYDDNFGGTSAASALVAAACVSVQAAARAHCQPGADVPLAPRLLRDLLQRTGVPQPFVDPPQYQLQNGHIGPLPDVGAAVAALGLGPFEDCNGNGLSDACEIATDRAVDCNGNSIPDECDLLGLVDTDGDGVADLCDNCPETINAEQRDCDGDCLGDTCAIALGVVDDCNRNGIPDSCETTARVVDRSEKFRFFGSNFPKEHTVSARRRATSDVVLTFRTRADLAGDLKVVNVFLGGEPVGVLYGDAIGCPDPPATEDAEIIVPASIFNAAYSCEIGPIVRMAVPSGLIFPVNPLGCQPETVITVEVSYTSSGPIANDDDADGCPDDCICPADLNCSGDVDIADLEYMYRSFGGCPRARPCTADLTGPNGVRDHLVDGLDVLFLLSRVGPCE